MPTFLKLMLAGALVVSTALAATAQAVDAVSQGPIPAGGFANCTQAYEAGYSNILRTSPAYAPRLDRDGDGVACER